MAGGRNKELPCGNYDRLEKEMKNIAILGYGIVGSGVFEVMNTNRELINKRAGEEVNVKYVLDLRDFPGDPVEKVLVHDISVILNDPEVDVVVEVMPGENPAYKFDKDALLAGKSVCTSNKAVVAKYGPELLEIARQKNLNFLFEASVGGGIPIIRAMNESLTADDVEKIMGILNGTTNYILTKMADEGWDFDKALKTAQDLGYAERNPEADIEGYDACRKIAILASLANGSHVDFEEIYTEGITKITACDFKYAKKMGRSIKLLGMTEKVNGCVFAMVAPFMVPSSHPLDGVKNAFNAIFVKGNMLGDAMLYGSGAGKLPTASAVCGDVVEAVKNVGKNIPIFWDDKKVELCSMENAKRQFMVRCEGNVDSKKAEVEALFGKSQFFTLEDVEGEFAFITPVMSEKEFGELYAKLAGAITRIRLEG